MTADLYNICRYCPLLVDYLNCEDLSQLDEISRRVIMFNIMLRLVNTTLFILHRLKLSCRSTFMRSITSSSSFITSAASPAARPATRQWIPSVSPRGNLCPEPMWWIFYICGLLFAAVGYSWMPLLKDGRMQSEELQLPVAAALPAGYLGQDAKKVRSCS